MPSFNISDEDRELIIKAVEAARNQPKLVDGIWWIWDFDKRRYVNTGEIGAVQAQTLGSLNNVTNEADQLDPDDQILIKKAGKSTWTLLNPDFTSRADVEALRQTVSSLHNATAAILQVLKYDEARDAWYIDGNFYATGQNAAGGIGEEEGGSGAAGVIIDEEMSDDSDNAVANRVIKSYIDALFSAFKENPKAYVPLKTINGLEIYGEGNIAIEGGSGEGTSGLTAINVNSQSFQPDSNGIVTLPDYPSLAGYAKMSDIPTTVAELSDADNYLSRIDGGHVMGYTQFYNGIKVLGGFSVSGLFLNGLGPDSTGITFDHVASEGKKLYGYNNQLYYDVDNAHKEKILTTSDLDTKVDKVDGKGLSTNDYTTTEKDKLAGIAAGAEVNVQSDWNATSGDAFIKNKPTLSVVATSGQYTDLTGTPKLAVVATSGSYEDLSNKPTIPVEVTETTVAGWGFTKNTGTYIKPTTGIPKSHLANAVQTSLGLADTALQPSALNDYPTTTQVGAALTEALKKYALAQDLTAVDGRLADVEAFFDSKDDKDSLVNKWHEIVNFLDATEGDTLDSILSTYAKGTDLASAIERIAANEATIETHTSQIITLQANNATLMAWYNAVGKYFKYDSVNEAWYLDGGFYTTGQNAAGGIGEEEGSTGGGLDEEQLEEYLTANGYLNSIPSEYVTETELSAKGYATTSALSAYALKSSLGTFASRDSLAFSELTSKPTTLNGYGITDAVVNIDSSDYPLPTDTQAFTSYCYANRGWKTTGPVISFPSGSYKGNIQLGMSADNPRMYINCIYNGSEGVWTEIITDLNISDFAVSVGAIAADVDLDDYSNAGVYGFWGNIANSQGGSFGTLLVTRATNDYFTGQLFTNHQGHLFSRIREGRTAAWRDWRTILDDNNYTEYVYSRTDSDAKYVPFAGHKTINGNVTFSGTVTSQGTFLTRYFGFTQDGIETGRLAADSSNHETLYFITQDSNYRVLIHNENIKGYTAGMASRLAKTVSIWGQEFDGSSDVKGELRGDKISNPANTAVTHQWRMVRANNALWLQVGTDAGETNGTLHLTGYSGTTANLISLNATTTSVQHALSVMGSSQLEGAVTAKNGLEVRLGLNVTSGESTFTPKVTCLNGVAVDGEGIMGITPDGGSYPRFRAFSAAAGFYFQAATYDGKSQNGNLYFSGMGGTRANEITFNATTSTISNALQVSGATSLNSSLTVSGGASIAGGLYDIPNIYGPTSGDHKKWCFVYNTSEEGTLFIQAGKDDASATDPHKGNLSFSGYGGQAMNRLYFSSDYTFFLGKYTYFRGTEEAVFSAKSTTINGTLAVNNHTDINSSMAVDAWLTVGGSLTMSNRIYMNNYGIRDCEEVYGAFPSGGTYPRWRFYANSGGFFFESSTYDGLNTNGTIAFRGYGGAKAELIKFYANNITLDGATSLNSTLSVDGMATFKSEVRSYNQLAILTTDGMDFTARLVPIIDGAQLQVGWQNRSSANGRFYFTGMGGVDLALFNARAKDTYFDGENVVFRNTVLNQFNAPSEFLSTLSVSGQATLSGGAFLPPSKTILFQDAATETFSISFNSEVGGLNLSGATRTLGLASFNKGIQIEYGQSIAFVDSNGVKQYITLDEANGAIKVIGNFFATGQNAAGGAGGEELGMLTSWENVPTNLEGVTLSASLGIDLYNNSKKVLTSWDDAPTDLTGYTVSADLVQTMNNTITELSGKTIPESVAIKLTNMCAAFATGSTLTYSNVSSYGLALTQIYGLRDGIYTKVIDDTSTFYNKVWEYGAEYSSSGYTFYFRMGDKTITLKSTSTLASSSYTITHNL